MRLLTLLVVLLPLFLSGCATPSQMYWDHRVKELCEKDGGVTVYEKVELTKSQKSKINIVPKDQVSSSNDYYLESKEELINKDPLVKKYMDFLYRNSDKKLLATKVYYSRVGGDIPTGISHPSTYSCDEVIGFAVLSERVFVNKGD